MVCPMNSSSTDSLSKRPDADLNVVDDDDDDVPLAVKMAKLKAQKPIPNGIEDEDDLPLSVKMARLKKTSKVSALEPPKKKPTMPKEPVKKSPAVVKALPKSAVPKPKKNNTKKEEVVEELEDEEEPEFRWWEVQEWDNTVKWETLEHNGPYFAPPYQPHGVRMLYDGRELALEPEAEEVAGFFAAMSHTDHAQNPIFVENFFTDFRQVLQKINSPFAAIIKDFKKCDFSPMSLHFERLREERKAMSKEEKARLKAEKAKLDEHYGVCLMNGRKEKVGNFRIEPPGLFRGRGKHPKAGKLKQRVQPEQVTINIGEGARVPEPPKGHQWGSIVHDNTVTWLATWIENVNKAPKYVYLAAGSSLKGQSDLKKFETARKLKNHVDDIRRVNAEELRSKEMLVRQRATALWLIDRLALRAGNEKGDDEADTVGCCSLRLEHVKLEEPNLLIFDFLGKDSIRYYNRVEVDPIIFKNMSIFMRPPKTATDPIFDRLTTTSLNKFLTGLMPGLTAKVFRTYNASITFQEELTKTPSGPEVSAGEQVIAYNRANRQVAVLCNHQKAVAKTFDQSMAKLKEKVICSVDYLINSL